MNLLRFWRSPLPDGKSKAEGHLPGALPDTRTTYFPSAVVSPKTQMPNAVFACPMTGPSGLFIFIVSCKNHNLVVRHTRKRSISVRVFKHNHTIVKARIANPNTLGIVFPQINKVTNEFNAPVPVPRKVFGFAIFSFTLLICSIITNPLRVQYVKFESKHR